MNMKKIKLLLVGLALCSMISLGGTMRGLDIQVPIGSTTHYQSIFSDSFSTKIKRFKIKTSLKSTKSTNESKVAEGKLTNTSKKAATGTLSRTKTKTSTYSLSFSIPKTALKTEVTASIGGALSYSTSTTISISGTIPAKSSRTVYSRDVKKVYTYNHDRQLQHYTKKKGWYNSGKSKTYTSKVTRKFPELIF